jgi:hypothetical protein
VDNFEYTGMRFYAADINVSYVMMTGFEERKVRIETSSYLPHTNLVASIDL